MPRTPMNYKNTVIYKIVCKDLSIDDCYVGHTTDFIMRRCRHKHAYHLDDKKQHFKLYTMIRENGGWDNWTMIEIEKFPCNDRNEAAARERYWFEQLNTKNMNTKKPVADNPRKRNCSVTPPRNTNTEQFKQDWINGLLNLQQSNDDSSDEWR